MFPLFPISLTHTQLTFLRSLRFLLAEAAMLPLRLFRVLPRYKKFTVGIRFRNIILIGLLASIQLALVLYQPRENNLYHDLLMPLTEW